jgi:hypothetical protein
MSEDQEAQIKGFLMVAYNVKGDIATSFNGHVPFLTRIKMRDALPIRPSAIHFCYNDVRTKPLLHLFQQVIGTQGRLRFRAHFGSHAECQYALLSFGILPGSLPVDTEGNMSCSYLNQWIEKQKFLESELKAQVAHHLSKLEYELSRIRGKPAYEKAKFLWPKSVTDPTFCLKFLQAADLNPHEAARLLLESLPSLNHDYDGNASLVDLMLWLETRKEDLELGTGIAPVSSTPDVIHSINIMFPCSNDILLGRGFAYQLFPGNQYFITVVEMHKERYNDAGSDREKKFSISNQVLRKIQDSGSRFLERAENEEDGWVQADDKDARQKVSNAFRNIRKRKGHAAAVDESIFC